MGKVHICYWRDAEEIYEKGLCYATQGSLGLDLRACMEQESITVASGERYAFPSGISIEVQEENIAAFVYSRSGLGAKEGLTVAQGVGVIDKDYRGEISIILLNTSQKDITVKRGDRIAQLLFQPAFQLLVEKVTSLSETARGSGGFGHTGKN